MMGRFDAGVEQQPVFQQVLEPQIALVTLNRPDARNAVNPELATRLERIVRDIEADPSISAAILTGAGDKAFCAGADLKEVAAGRLLDCFTSESGFGGFVNAERSKPWIAAVNGAALAGGFEMVLACDLVVASETATFGLPEVKRGLIASAGGLYRLPRVLPRPVALELIVTGASMSAGRALDFGIVNSVTSPADLIRRACEFALQISANSPLAVRESLRIAKLASGFSDPEMRADAERTQERLQKSADYLEGSRAFVEKRPPKWTGR